MRRNAAEITLSAGRGREVCRDRWGCVLLQQEGASVGEEEEREREGRYTRVV